MNPTIRRLSRLLVLVLAATTLAACCFHGHHCGLSYDVHWHAPCR
jgi:hypothetical protein